MSNSFESLKFLAKRWGIDTDKIKRLLEVDDLLRGSQHGDDCAALKELKSELCNILANKPKHSTCRETLMFVINLIDKIIAKRTK